MQLTPTRMAIIKTTDHNSVTGICEDEEKLGTSYFVGGNVMLQAI